MMSSGLLKTFLSIDKERNLTTLLWVITFATGLLGSTNEIATTVAVALFQLFFILGYAFSYRQFPAYQLLRRQQWLYRLFCLWALLITLSYVKVFFAGHEQQGFYQIAASVRQLTWFLHVMFVICVASFIMQIGKRQAVLFEVMTSCSLILLLYLYLWASQPVIDGEIWFMSPPLGFHARLLGYLFVVAFAVSLAGYLCTSHLLKRQGFLLLMLVFVAMLFWLGGRASMLAAMSSALFAGIYILAVDRQSWAKLPVLLLVFIAAGFIAEPFMLFDWNGFDKVARANLGHIAAGTDQVVNMNALTTGRLQIWKEVWQAMQNDIWLGLGPNGYIFIPGHREGFGIHPHNLFVQFLAEWGICGLALTVTLMAAVIWQLLCRFGGLLRNREVAPVSAALVLVVLFVNGLADGTFYHAQSLYYIALAVALFPFFSGSNRIQS